MIRRLGRGGTDLPGRIALKLCPDLLGRLAKDVTAIVVTGTNGKTTTSRMIEQALSDSGISFFANQSGANLMGGVTTEFACHSGILSGKCRYPYALIESDEGAFPSITKNIKPKQIVVTNFFRDQLDRYGEVSHTVNKIRTGIANCPEATLCLNADDSLCASLAEDVPNPVIFFGVNTPVYKEQVHDVSDAPYCIHCKSEYVYDYITYGHLGGYRCPKCGYSRPVPDVAVTAVKSSDAECSAIEITTDGRTLPAVVNLPGGYNIYNAVACMAAAKGLGLDLQLTAEGLARFRCGFGRMEKFEINGTPVRMILIKNPAGCNQVLNFLTNTQGKLVFAAALNDRAQDGRDISWIWDVDFEKLLSLGDDLEAVYVSGIRAEDMALRFKYAGIPGEKLHLEKDYDRLMEQMTAQPNPVYLMPTYTAMLHMRDRISRKYGFKEYWEA